jgi:hypothetical protein
MNRLFRVILIFLYQLFLPQESFLRRSPFNGIANGIGEEEGV